MLTSAVLPFESARLMLPVRIQTDLMFVLVKLDLAEDIALVRVFLHNYISHSNPSNDSEPAPHLREKPSHPFDRRILCTAQSFYKRRIVEGLIIQ